MREINLWWGRGIKIRWGNLLGVSKFLAGGGTLPSKENPGHGCDFSEKGQGNVGKGQDI